MKTVNLLRGGCLLGLLLVVLDGATLAAQSQAQSGSVVELESPVARYIGREPGECGRYIGSKSVEPFANSEALHSSLACGLTSASAKAPFWIVLGGSSFCSGFSAQGIFGDTSGALYSFRYSRGVGRPRTLDVRHCLKLDVSDVHNPDGIVCAVEKPLLVSEITAYSKIVWNDLKFFVRRIVPWRTLAR